MPLLTHKTPMPHATITPSMIHIQSRHIQPCQVRTRHTHNCQDSLNYGRDEDPAKSTYSIMAFIERGLSAGRAVAIQ